MTRKLTVTAAVGLAIYLAGCTGGGFRSEQRADRLMAMAACEAAQVSSPADRLRSQLNIAEMQTRQGYVSAARKTLSQAMATLESAGDQLPVQTRLAGWVSVSELSRDVYDRATASKACNVAVEQLRAVQPQAERCQYVRGVAHEIRWLHGKRQAAIMLDEAYPWAAAIDDLAERRQALTALASDLFLYDDYDGGSKMLAMEPDSKWRTEVLTQLAQSAVPLKGYGKLMSYSVNFASGSGK